MDTSSSMEGTPISVLKQTANQLFRSVFDNSDQSYMSLMGYSSSTKLLNGFAPSTNINTFINQINGLDANGLTEIGNALSKTRDMVTQRKSALDSQRLFDRRICVIFMSDGQPTDSIDRVYNMADHLHALNYVDVYTVGFFHDVNSSIRKTCEDILRYIASDSGKFYNVNSSTDFYWIFSDILDSLTQSQRTIITVDCPVDVSVTFDGETLDSSNTRTSFGALQFEGAGNERKVLRLEAENDYRVTMKGTGAGYMDYTIQYVDANGEYSDTRKIVGIPVEYGMEAYSETQQGSSTSVYSSLNGNSPQIEYSARAGEKKVYNDHTSPVSSYSAGFAATASSCESPRATWVP